MNFDLLPTEIIVKIAKSCENETNECLKQTNKRTCSILTRAGLPPPFLRELSIERDAFHLTVSNGSLVRVPTFDRGSDDGPILKYLQDNKIEAITKLVVYPGFFISSCFSSIIRSFEPTFNTINPVKTIDKFEHHGFPNRHFEDVVKFHEYTADVLELYKVKSVSFRNYRYCILYDEFISTIPVHVDIEVHDDQFSRRDWSGGFPYELLIDDLTDETLKGLLQNRRKIFKFSGYSPEFTSPMLAETIETALLNNWDVDWELGFIRWPQPRDFKKLENISGLSLDWEQNYSKCRRYINYKLSKGRATVRFASTVNLLG